MMSIEIIAGNFAQFLTLAGGYSLFRQTIRGPTAGLHLNEHKVLPFFGNQINLAMPTTIVLFQYTISAPCQRLCRQPFTGAAQALACDVLRTFVLPNGAYTLLHQSLHIYLRCFLIVRCNSLSLMLLSYAIVVIWATGNSITKYFPVGMRTTGNAHRGRRGEPAPMGVSHR